MTTLRWPTEIDDKARRERIAVTVMPAIVRIMPAAPNEDIARQAVGLADALIKELDKERQP